MGAKKSLLPEQSPETGLGEINLADIVGMARVQELLEALSRIAGPSVGVIDLEGRILAAAGWHRICTDFHRPHPGSGRSCVESDTVLTAGLERGKSILYKCKNNLWDIATPIFVEGRKLGNLFMGQFLLEGDEPSVDIFRAQAREFGFDEKEYLDALAEIPRISREKIEQVMDLFVKVADQVSELGARNLQLARILERNKALLDRLADSESLLGIAGELVSLGGWQYYAGEDRFSYSEKVAEIHEVPPGYEPTLEEVIEFSAPEYRRRIRKVFRDCLGKGDPFDEEMEIITGNGRRVWVRTVGTAVRDETGRVARIQGALQDISRLKRAEEALKEREEHLRSVFENSTTGIFRITSEGRFLLANPAVVAMLGYSSFEELASRYLPEWGFEAGRDDGVHFREMVARDGEVRGLESAWIKRDGSKAFIRISGRAVRGDDGAVLFYEGTVEDITARKRSDEELKKKNDLIRMAGELASVGGWSMNLDENRTVWTDEAARIHEQPPGFSAAVEDALGFYDPESRLLMEKLFGECVRNGTPFDEEFRKITGTGRAIWVREIGEAVRDGAGKIVGAQGAFQDITEHRKLERDYIALFREMLDGFALCEVISDEFGEPVDFRFITVNPAYERLTGLHGRDIIGKTVREVLPGIEDSWVRRFGKVALTGEPVSFVDYAAPLGKYYEVKAYSPSPGVFAALSADVTDRKRAEEKLRHALETTIGVLTQTVERRDPYTAGHQRRVGALAAGIAREMGLGPEREDQVRMAGFVHDLGKISVPAEILSKPGKLSELEMNIIREHPAHGRDILQDVESDLGLAMIVYQHHERVDGSGYPEGLKGDEISLEARILAVADVVEAMASYRPYRPAVGLEEALKEIEVNAGTLYDPDVARTCLRLFREKGYRLES